MIKLKLSGPFRDENYRDGIDIEAETVDIALTRLLEVSPSLEKRLFRDGRLNRFVNIFVNGEDIRHLGGTATNLASGDEVSIIPSIAGG